MTRPLRPLLTVGFLLCLACDHAAGQGFIGPRSTVVVMGRGTEPTEKPPGRLLGTFYPESTVNIMGSDPVRGGYAPLDMYGLTTLSLYGPESTFRMKSAPIVTYQRGYDGIVRPSLGVSMSYPNFPDASPVLYPTRANYFSHFPTSGVPPTWRRSFYWLDQE